MGENPESPASVTSLQDPPSQKLNDEVDLAVSKFVAFQLRLNALLCALRDHHASMVDTSEKRLKAAKEFEMLMTDTPMESVVGAVTILDDPPPTAEGGKKFPSMKINISPGGKDKSGARTKSVSELLGKDEIATAFEPAALAEGDGYADVEKTLGAVNEAAHKITTRYADRYRGCIIKYAEDWEKIISSKVKARRNEFNKLKENLSHYEKKVAELRSTMDKKGKVSDKGAEKINRNEDKLIGAREAHEEWGERFLLLLDEITARAWKDVYPLMMMALNFHANFAIDEAEIFSKLKETAKTLEEIGTEKKLDIGGRLNALKDGRAEEIFTGDRDTLLPKKTAKAEWFDKE